MKKLLVIALLPLLSPAYAQKIPDSKVPEPVKTAFTHNFPKITGARWEKENGNYEANFREAGVQMSSTFSADGALVETERTISVRQLPAAVNTYVQQHYKGEKIKGASKLTLANRQTNYEAELKGKDIIFDANGKFIKESKD